jgi:PIN domain nuclease of toxin-antitoxin system
LVPAPLILLPVTLEYVRQIEALPFHHRDPFDRMLIAQALSENLVIMTDDQHFSLYPVKII